MMCAFSAPNTPAMKAERSNIQVFAKSLIPVGHQILLGVLLAIMVLIAPNGLAGLMSRFRAKLGEKSHAGA